MLLKSQPSLEANKAALLAFIYQTFVYTPLFSVRHRLELVYTDFSVSFQVFALQTERSVVTDGERTKNVLTSLLRLAPEIICVIVENR